MPKEPWEFVKTTLLRNGVMEPVNRARMLIVAAIGGCGKSQLLLKFMKDHKSEFSCQVFIDGSSKDRIRANTMQYVRSLGTEHSQKSFEGCLVFLSSPRVDGVRLLLYDNVDDPDLDIAPPLSWGDSYAIAITSRSGIFGGLYPEGHLRLGIMAQEEAVKLVFLAYKPSEAPLGQNRTELIAIVEALSYLLITLQQASAYMRQTETSPRKYLQQLSTSKKNLPCQSIKHQPDSRSISTYAAFETSFSSLPVRCQEILWLLSYCHWGGFPLSLVKLAIRYKFWECEQWEFDNGDELTAGNIKLDDIFYHYGKWDESKLEAMLSSLRSYSLTSVISTVDTSLLQMHPLVHVWVQNTIPEDERGDYPSAAVLFLAIPPKGCHSGAMEHILSKHVGIESMKSLTSTADSPRLRHFTRKPSRTRQNLHFLKERFVFITGIGGCGKTQLALRFVDKWNRRFKSVVWIDASNAKTIKRDLSAYERAFSGAEWILVLDNADDPDLDLSPFSQWGNGWVLVTGRRTSYSPPECSLHFQLDAMFPDEAVELLLRSSGRAVLPLQQERQEADTLSQELGFLPLAILQAGAYIRQTGLLMNMYLSGLHTTWRLFGHSKNQIVDCWHKNISVDDLTPMAV